jgi:uncharacterized protein
LEKIMPFSLYDATIPGFRQMLGTVLRLLDKAEAWGTANGVSEQDMLAARLAPDMFPFSYQVKSTAVHSIGAIEGVRRGHFAPDTTTPPESFDGLRNQVTTANDALAALSPDEVNSFIGREMYFMFKERRMDFTGAETFLMSFSLPNLMFHATTTYDILRMKGLDIGKRDFMGKLALKH